MKTRHQNTRRPIKRTDNRGLFTVHAPSGCVIGRWHPNGALQSLINQLNSNAPANCYFSKKTGTNAPKYFTPISVNPSGKRINTQKAGQPPRDAWIITL